ncbi:MAG TPA: hypothetical protein VNJ08_02900 [Bacteriovoracaceae bacterium]|nr:hypothetical protein [Bacteriovoracaceae bacterium]
MSLFKRLITWLMYKKLSQINSLYQSHAGQECYIFGDGTSVKWIDLHQLGNKPSILGNMSIYHKEVSALNALYCCVIEPYFFYPFFPTLYKGKLRMLKHHLHTEYRKSIKQNPGKLFFINISNFPVARFRNAMFVSRKYLPPFKEKNLFKDRTDTHDGTLKFQISLAIFLGFKKAYLVGHDYTHSNSKSLHFYEKGEGVTNDNKDFCKEFLDHAKQHIDLVTVTLAGESDTLDSITYMELTGQDPKYRENYEIVDKAKLDCLNTWHGYTVF